MSAALSGLLRLTAPKSPGPPASFTEAQFLLAFITIGSSGTIGRASLAKRAGMGDGAVRTVLKKLKASGFADSDASGCHLTPAGAKAHESIGRKLSVLLSLGETRLTVGKMQAAVAVRGGGRLVEAGIEQRDSAVKAGARGATTYVVRGGRFTVPGASSDCETDFPSPAWKVLRDTLAPRDGDAVILSGSSEERTAVLGALSAAITLA